MNLTPLTNFPSSATGMYYTYDNLLDIRKSGIWHGVKVRTSWPIGWQHYFRMDQIGRSRNPNCIWDLASPTPQNS